MDVLLRNRGTHDVSRIDYYEFQARIRKGEISPDDEVKDDVLTKSEWWPVRDLRLFHRLSSIACEPGHRLQRRYQLEEEERQANEAARARLAEPARKAWEFFRTPEDEFGALKVYLFLRQHNERPLWEYDRAVRFAYVPTYELPLFVRVSSIHDAWELAAARGFSQGIARRIEKEIAGRVTEFARRAKLSAMPVEERTFGCDGATWVVEFVAKGDYVVRKRWSPTAWGRSLLPELKGFVALAEYMAGLSGLLQPNQRMQ